MYKILFVCTGNICRSPTAEGMARRYAKDAGLSESLLIDSAGTHGYHVGDPPDPRAVAAAKKRGIPIDGLRARKVTEADFYAFDLILALDSEHLQFLRQMAPQDATAHIALFLEYCGMSQNIDVPDPYYGELQGFEHVLDLMEPATQALLQKCAHANP